jgi:hypothetical protein
MSTFSELFFFAPQVDGFSILLDCGWDDSFNLALLESVKR